MRLHGPKPLKHHAVLRFLFAKVDNVSRLPVKSPFGETNIFVSFLVMNGSGDAFTEICSFLILNRGGGARQNLLLISELYLYSQKMFIVCY